MQKIVNGWGFGLVGLGLLFFMACGSGDPADRSLDALEAAVRQVESQTNEYIQAAQDPAARESIKEHLGNLTKAGSAMQQAYAPVRDLDLPSLSMNQEKRRGELQQRAMAAAADLLNITVSKPAAP